MTLTLLRGAVVHIPGKESFTPGVLSHAGVRFGYTCEDEDRVLETNSEGKIYGRTAIPRGRYRMEVTFSNRFQRPLPLLLGVPGFAGIRVHGGNTAENSQGCVLLGQLRTATGVAQCAGVVNRLIALIKSTEARGDELWIEIQ